MCDVTDQRTRKVRVKASAKRVKSKEIIDAVASDESNKEQDGSVGSVGSVGGSDKRKPQTSKSKSRRNTVVDKDSKPHRKRQALSKVYITCWSCNYKQLFGRCSTVYTIYMYVLVYKCTSAG